MYRIAIDDVIALLRPETVISACGIDATQRRRAWRLKVCPFCGSKPSRQGCAIYRRKRDQSWRASHHGHTGCAGDLLDVVAAVEGIDRKRNLPKLLERAAQIAGIVPNDPDVERRIAERIATDRARQAREDAERVAALAAMPGVWTALDRRSLVGERYLQTRGFDPTELRAQGDIIRFSASGEIALPMRSLETGAIVGIQYRTAGEKGFRTEPHSDADDSALVGKPTDLDPDGVDVAVVVEGLADTLAARLSFPGCAVYGAVGCGQLASIVDSISPRVLECRGWLLLVPHDDEPGIENAAEAVGAAQTAGLHYVPIDESRLEGASTVRLVDLGEHNDLADAWKAGWRWQWPKRGGVA